MGNKDKLITKEDLENAKRDGAREFKSAILQLLDIQQYAYEKKMSISEDAEEREVYNTIIQTYENVVATIKGITL